MDGYVRRQATRAFGGIGEAAATPEFLDRIAALLADPDSGVRSEAADAVGEMGAAAAKPVILDQITALLVDQDEGVRFRAARAVATLMDSGKLRLFHTRLIPVRWETVSVAELAATPAPMGLLSFKA